MIHICILDFLVVIFLTKSIITKVWATLCHFKTKWLHRFKISNITTTLSEGLSLQTGIKLKGSVASIIQPTLKEISSNESEHRQMLKYSL